MKLNEPKRQEIRQTEFLATDGKLYFDLLHAPTEERTPVSPRALRRGDLNFCFHHVVLHFTEEELLN